MLMSRPLFTFLSNVLLSCPFALPKAKEYFVGLSFKKMFPFALPKAKELVSGFCFKI